MKIDKKMNLVISVDREDGGKLYVHSTPIMRETFERYYLVMSKAFSKLFGEGLGIIGGPRVAALILRDLAIAGEIWEGPEGVKQGLFNEIKRLTNVIAPTDQGWRAMPFYDQAQTLFSGDEISEVEGIIVFFILISAVQKKDQVLGILGVMVGLWGAQLTYSNCTEFASSLAMSIKQETSPFQAASSEASLIGSQGQGLNPSSKNSTLPTKPLPSSDSVT